MNTNPDEFQRFIRLLMNGAPDGYTPHLIALEPNGKDPIKGHSWKLPPLTIEEAIKILGQGNNVGIAARKDDLLVIVDRDDPNVKRTKPTLTTKSRRRIGEHDFYFRTPDVLIPNTATEHHGELRVNDQYVVAAGSYVPCTPSEKEDIPREDRENAGRYTIKDAQAPAIITTLEQLPDIFVDQIYRNRADDEAKQKPREEFTPHPNINPMYKLTWKDILPGAPEGVRIAHPLHDSETGKNFIIQGELAHCWRHNVSLTPLQFMAVKNGLLGCLDAGVGHKGSGKTHSKLTGNEEILNKLHAILIKGGYIKPTENKPYLFKRKNKNGKIETIINPALLAETILQNGHKCLSFKDTDELLTYQDGIYIPGEGTVAQAAQKHLKEETRNYYINEVIGYIKRATYIDRVAFDARLEIINTKNGLLNLLKNELEPHTHTYPSLSALPIEYTPSLDCPRFKKFLLEIMPQDDIPLVQEFFGYCLYRDYPIQKAFMLLGPGANGKSTLLGVLKAFLGKENTASIGLQELGENKFAVAQLYGKLANIHDDLPARTIQSSGVFKQITGGSLLNAEKKFQNPFNFVNHAKIIFSANKLPNSTDDTDAFFRRWIIINFPHQFEGTQANKSLLKELTTPQELSGVLNWALEGLQRLLQVKSFSDGLSTEQIREAYKRKSNPIAAFILDCIEENREAIIEKDVLYNYYKVYCIKNKLPTEAKNTFARELNRHIPYLDTTRTGKRGERARVWKGISLSLESIETFGVHDVSMIEQGILDTEYLEPENITKKHNSVHDVHDVHPFNTIAGAAPYSTSLLDSSPKSKENKGEAPDNSINRPITLDIVDTSKKHKKLDDNKSQREIVYILLENIKEYEKEFGTAKLQEIIKKAIPEGLSESQVIHGLALLAKDGVIYEPRPNHFKVV